MMRLENAPWMQWPQTRALVEAFADAGNPMRFVGGCVRDSLLNRPVQDVDIATPVMPEGVMALLEKAGIRAIPTGIDHGTVTALIDAKHFEITTLRRDVACDGRHAEVEYTDDWKQDAARRDFTINALYADASGEVHDYFGGLAHLKPVQVIFIGDPRARIDEDALRILRFFRFSAQLGVKTPDAAALTACTEKSRLLLGLSGERIAQEMLKLLAVPVLDSALLAQMQRAHILEEVHLPAPSKAITHPALASDALARLACWLMSSSDAHEQATELRIHWKISSAQHLMLDTLMFVAEQLPALTERQQKALLRLEGKEVFCRVVRIAWAREPERESSYKEMLALAGSWQIPEFPLRGHDLLDRGYAEGKDLGDQLKKLEQQWEDEDYHPTREELLKRLPKGGS